MCFESWAHRIHWQIRYRVWQKMRSQGWLHSLSNWDWKWCGQNRIGVGKNWVFNFGHVDFERVLRHASGDCHVGSQRHTSRNQKQNLDERWIWDSWAHISTWSHGPGHISKGVSVVRKKDQRDAPKPSTCRESVESQEVDGVVQCCWKGKCDED